MAFGGGQYGGWSGSSGGQSSSGGNGMAWAAAIGQGFGTYKQNQRNRQQAKILRSWQERMSNTAIQRRMADMKAAGINPVLAARFDATTPPGAMAQMQNIGEGAVSGYTSAKNAKTARMLADKQVALLDSEIAVNEANAKERNSVASLNEIRQQLAEYDVDVREKTALFIQMGLSFIPQDIRDNPSRTKAWVLEKLDKFREMNPELERIWTKLSRDIIRIVEGMVSGLANVVDPPSGGNDNRTPRQSDDWYEKKYQEYLQYRKNKGRWSFKKSFEDWLEDQPFK